MNVFSTATAAALLAAAATLAAAQTQGQMPPQTRLGPNAAFSPAKGASTPAEIAATAAQEGIIEVALGGLALQKSSNNQVKQFAQRMVQDHGQANQELQSLVERKGLILPTKLDAKYEAMVGSLNAKSGAAFDKAYVKLMAKDHDQAVARFESASKSSDPDMAAFARKTLATLQEHKQLADDLRVSIGITTASAR